MSLHLISPAYGCLTCTSVKAKLRDIGWGQEVDMLDPEDKSPLSKNKHVMGKRAINEDSTHII